MLCHASVDALQESGNWLLSVDFDGNVENYEIMPNREPHGPIVHKTFTLSAKDSVFMSRKELEAVDKP